MQINTSYHSNFSNYHKTAQQEEYIKDADLADAVKVQEQKTQKKSEVSLPPIGELQRQTYGLAILELMSDDEYRAFLRATAQMTESQKIMSAQSLYRLSELYQGKFTNQQNKNNPYISEDFITTYQNAYQSIIEQNSH